jgi:hypothetical protein
VKFLWINNRPGNPAHQQEKGMEQKLKPWNLKQLYEAHLRDLEDCCAEHEKMMCKTLNFKEMREKALEIKRVRKLTPGEQSILDTINNA